MPFQIYEYMLSIFHALLVIFNFNLCCFEILASFLYNSSFFLFGSQTNTVTAELLVMVPL